MGASKFRGLAMWRLLSLVFLFTVAACTETAIGAIDEKVSQWTDRECSTVFMMLGDNYCREKRVIGDRPGERIHCFRTLGGVDCYAEADPYGINGSGRARQSTRLTDPGAPPSQRTEEVPVAAAPAAVPVKPVTAAPLVAASEPPTADH